MKKILHGDEFENAAEQSREVKALQLKATQLREEMTLLKS